VTFHDIFSIPLLVRALQAGALAGLCCAALSPLVVLRRMAFVGDGMAHAAFGGIGLALYVLADSSYDDWSVQAITVGFCLALALAIGRVSRNTESKISEDSAIGIAFSVSMALGALFIKLRQRQQTYVTSMDVYLFGSIMNVSPRDVWVLVVLGVAVLALLFVFQKELLFYAFDARLAELSGLNVRVLHYAFLLLLVLTVVVSSRVVGIVLVSASLILPGVTALKVCQRLLPALALSAFLGIFSFCVGMYFSCQQNVYPGSAIILTQFALLLLASVWSMATASRH
jgi:ABC-type Mn2+/Zn2+ transport system permease subunit